MQHPIIKTARLGSQWETRNPFLFCAHHLDAYPRGNGRLEPDAPLAGRDLGEDFEGRDGWRMYHGERIPGFPVHPHRGFETVTIVLEGFVDHSDSNRAAGRYSSGDVQWMSAGSGLQHSEMFPMVYTDRPNPLHLFQVWLNLPARGKAGAPQWRMFWSEDIPEVLTTYGDGQKARVRIIAGSFQGRAALAPPPDSWAARRENRVRILLASLDPGAPLELENPGSPTLERTVYIFAGQTVSIAGQVIEAGSGVQLDGNAAVTIVNGVQACQLLVLEGEPIDEPVVARGPFVMNSIEEIRKAIRDYQETEFGGWPWDRPDPVHGTGPVRFARSADGTGVQRSAAQAANDPATAIGG